MREPTFPSFTRRYSSSPMGESTLRVMVAERRGRAGAGSPSMRCSNGQRNSSEVSTADTG